MWLFQTPSLQVFPFFLSTIWWKVQFFSATPYHHTECLWWRNVVISCSSKANCCKNLLHILRVITATQVIFLTHTHARTTTTTHLRNIRCRHQSKALQTLNIAVCCWYDCCSRGQLAHNRHRRWGCWLNWNQGSGCTSLNTNWWGSGWEDNAMNVLLCADASRYHSWFWCLRKGQ